MMLKKRGNVFEEHIEKAILVVVGVACAYVLVRYVLLSPNVVTYDNRKFTPGQLDIYIEGQSEKIKERLNGVAAEMNKTYEPCSPVFIAKMDCTLEVDMNIVWPVPSSVEMKFEKRYRIPEVGQVKDVAAEHIRAAKYIKSYRPSIGWIGPESSNERTAKATGESSETPSDIKRPKPTRSVVLA
jgi:hypothetical protein